MKNIFLLTILLYGAVTATHSAPIEKTGIADRNPFRFYDKKIRKVPKLEMVLISKSRKTALIDGMEYQIGSLFGKSRIITIAIDHIELSSGGKIRKVSIDEAVR